MKNLHQKLLLGTERSPADSPAKLLDELAAETLLARAGFPLAKATQSPISHSQAPENEALALCPAPAAKLFAQSLAGKFAATLPEFLAQLAKHGMEPPPEFLPEILDRAARDGQFFQKIRPLLGQRARWLAGQNPRWLGLFLEKKPGKKEVERKAEAAVELNAATEFFNSETPAPLEFLGQLEIGWTRPLLHQFLAQLNAALGSASWWALNHEFVRRALRQAGAFAEPQHVFEFGADGFSRDGYRPFQAELDLFFEVTRFRHQFLRALSD